MALISPPSSRAETLARWRAWLALLLGALFVLSQYASLGDPLWGANALLHLLAWFGWCATLALYLLFSSGALFGARIGRLLNDEGVREHLRRAQQLGHACALAMGALVYVASFYETLSARDACRLIVTATVAPALLRFGWLEWRALQHAE